MSIEQEVGKLVGLVEGQAKDIAYIKQNMVTRREFDFRVSEHSEFRAGISGLGQKVDALESHRDRNHWLRVVGNRVLYIVVGTLVVAGLAIVGL